jgi:catechol 2,3-dioxygenase-like lactoylglutathione lyase family enzyme
VIDHIAVNVSDYERSKAFYLAALAPAGYELVMEFGKAGGFGPQGRPVLWLREQEPVASMHIAVMARDRAEWLGVRAWPLSARRPTREVLSMLDPDREFSASS